MDDISGRGQGGELRPGWYAVARSKALKSKPLRVVFDGLPYVLWRTRDGIGARLDICPHRGAPLSLGRVEDGEIACPYHGWRFDGDGRCRHMPGLDGPPLPAHVSGLTAGEGGGLVFLWWPGRERVEQYPLPINSLVDGGASVIMTGEVRTSLADFAENILDTTHTSVVHGGYLRGREGRRAVTPEVVTGPDWVEARYPPAATPDGLMGRLIGAKGYHITDRFRAPNITEVEYRQGNAVVFAVRFHLTPTEAGKVAAFAVMTVKGAQWKVQVMRWLFRRIIAEDRLILEAVSKNRSKFGRSPCYVAPQDVMRQGIDAILRGDEPVTPDRVALRV